MGIALMGGERLVTVPNFGVIQGARTVAKPPEKLEFRRKDGKR
jgi:hypothetical protein